jgi:ABC-type phosphate transport system permease subunit
VLHVASLEGTNPPFSDSLQSCSLLLKHSQVTPVSKNSRMDIEAPIHIYTTRHRYRRIHRVLWALTFVLVIYSIGIFLDKGR